MSGGLYADTYELIALMIALNVLNALALQPEHLTGLRSRRDLHFNLTLKCRHIDFRAQGGLHEADGEIAKDIQIVANEYRMRLHLDHHVQIARGAARCRRRLTFSSELQPRAGVYARGYFDAERVHFPDTTGSGTRGAGILDDAALAVALAA